MILKEFDQAEIHRTRDSPDAVDWSRLVSSDPICERPRTDDVFR